MMLLILMSNGPYQRQGIGNCRKAQNPYYDSLFCCGWRILWNLNSRSIGFGPSGFDIDLMDTANRMFVVRLAGKTLGDSSNTHANLWNNKNWFLFKQTKSLLMLRTINIHNTILVYRFIRVKKILEIVLLSNYIWINRKRKVSSCKFWIYWVSVNTIQVVISSHVVNFVFTPTR